MKQRIYIAIDLKSFYASVECRERGLDPLDTKRAGVVRIEERLSSFSTACSTRLTRLNQEAHCN